MARHRQKKDYSTLSKSVPTLVSLTVLAIVFILVIKVVQKVVGVDY